MTAGQIAASTSVNEKLFKRLKSLTRNNQHGEAYQIAARALGQEALHDQFARIERHRARIGHLPYDLNQERDQVYTEMMQVAKRQLSPAQYNCFYMCF